MRLYAHHHVGRRRARQGAACAPRRGSLPAPMTQASSQPSSSFPYVPSAGAVLVVDDDATTRVLVARWLSSAGMRVVEAASGDEALITVKRAPTSFDAIVLDVMMPGLSGWDVLDRLRSDEELAPIPVLLVSAHANDDVDLVRSLRHGAVDHVAKPFRGSVLTAKVQAFGERRRVQMALELRLAQAETNATTDTLTGLWNRRHFEAMLSAELALAERHHDPFALALCDLDHFKAINDLFGHTEGDRVLRHVAEVIRSGLRPGDAAFRVGGEEFALLLRATDGEGGVTVAERVRATLADSPVALGVEPRVITMSVGVAGVDAIHEFDGSDVVARADAALYQAKRMGRDRVDLAR